MRCTTVPQSVETIVDVQPDLAQEVGADLTDRGDARHVGGAEEDHFLAVVAGRHDLFAQRRQVRVGAEILHSGVGGVDRTGGEKADVVVDDAGVGFPATAVMNSFWFTARNAARRIAGLSNGGYRWLKRSTPIRPVVSITSTRRLRSALQRWHQVHDRLLDPIDLAGVQGGGLGGRVGRRQPFDPVEIGDARAGAEAGDTLARQVFLELRIGVARAGDAFIRQEAERAAADHLVQQRGGRGLGQPLRHNRRHQVGRLGQRLGQQRKRRFSRKTTCLSVGADRSSVAAISAWPNASLAAQRRRLATDVAAQNRRAVVEQQPVAQRQRPDLLIGVDGMTGQHLVLRHAGGIQREQRIEYHHAHGCA